MNSKELHKLKDLKDFIERHGKSSHYGFQLKKCGNCPYCVLNPIRLDDAEFNKLHFLPDPIPDETGQHYKPFDQLYGMMTNDKHRPSFANVQGIEAEADKINRDVLKSGKSRDVILCSECFKPRCVYSNTKMTREQDGILLRIKEDDNYTCGDAFPEDSGLFVRESLSCNSEVEINYFGAAMRHFVPPCCIYCGKTEDLLDDEDDYIQNLYTMFSVVRPLCKTCRTSGKEAKTWGEKFFAKRS
ncbi:unnamed protein product [Mytilus coruscus]|uniref:Uncharacterized protein n=1 Tax=Mytilus coruscus TaxID=42192 RepID=A0A6J8AFT9_MYTCO|nr:unnamed protein product [Mytilus coruscus]